MNSTTPDAARPIDKACETLLQAAIQAPSGDNTQPWRFFVDSRSRRIAIYLEEDCDPSPMNSGQRMSRLAIGAALENMLRTAEMLGWTVKLEEPGDDPLVADFAARVRAVRKREKPEEVSDNLLALLRIIDCRNASGDVPDVIMNRGTNRKKYDGRTLPKEMATDLERSVVALPGVKTFWIHKPERVVALADFVGKADALMLGEPLIRKAFLDNVHFDLPWNTVVNHFLSLGSLELTWAKRLALRIVRHLPNWLLRVGRISDVFAAAARRLVASSAGICIVTESAGTHQSELLAGRTVQRLWLALAERGIAVQPLMSIAILESVLQRGSLEVLASLGRPQAKALVDELRILVPEIGEANLAFLMRFGYAPPPTVRTGRLELNAKVTEISG